jgi:hypothetical protein
MSFAFRLGDYARYLERAGDATYLDVTRRTDPARVERVWDNLRAVVRTYGTPWIVQIWTKDAAGTIRRGGQVLKELRNAGTTLAAQLTVTGLGGTSWEPLVPSTPFRGAEELISLLGGSEHIRWRYDPVIPTVHRMHVFRGLAERAASLGIKRCVLNFLVPPGRYKRVDARLSAALPGWSAGMPGYDENWRARAAAALFETARDFGLSVGVCAESSGLTRQVRGLQPAACGDQGWFAALSGRDPDRARTAISVSTAMRARDHESTACSARMPSGVIPRTKYFSSARKLRKMTMKAVDAWTMRGLSS